MVVQKTARRAALRSSLASLDLTLGASQRAFLRRTTWLPQGCRLVTRPPNCAKYSMWLAAEPGILHPPQVVKAVDPDRDSLDLGV